MVKSGTHAGIIKVELTLDQARTLCQRISEELIRLPTSSNAAYLLEAIEQKVHFAMGVARDASDPR